MQFSSLIALFAVVAAVSAAPAPLRMRQNTCDIKTCVLDLAPSVVSCGAAAAQAGADPFSDAACVLAAVKDVAELPASCDGCSDQLGIADTIESAKNAIEGIF